MFCPAIDFFHVFPDLCFLRPPKSIWLTCSITPKPVIVVDQYVYCKGVESDTFSIGVKKYQCGSRYGFRWIFSCHALHSCDSVFDYPRSRARSVEWMTSRCVSDGIHSLLGRCPRFCHPSGRARRSGFSGGIRTDLVPGAPHPLRGLIPLVPDSHHSGVYAACRILDHG